MCVQSSSVLRVLQFTPFNVVCYVLHRSVSQVIHGQQLSSLQTIASVKSMAVSGVEEASRLDNLIVLSNNPFTHQVCDFSPASTPIPRHCAHYEHWQAALTSHIQRLGQGGTTTPKLASFLSVMIHPLVHQRIPCYDFYFL